MATQARPTDSDSLAARYAAVRGLSLAIAAPLSDADASVQPMPDASPAKWHLAHTTWFFETFVLRDHLPGYRAYDESFAYLFNSYYEGEGERHPRAERGMIARPSLDEVRAWRAAVDEALLGAIGDLPAELITLGLNHEQQHQELMLMDLTATFFANPLRPALWERGPAPAAPLARPDQLARGRARAWSRSAMTAPTSPSIAKGRATRRFLHPHALADRTVTNAEWLSLHRRRRLCKSAALARRRLGLGARERDRGAALLGEGRGGWSRFALDGLRPLDPAEPVCHISYYEADAYARWAGARLPTEAEWESAAAPLDPDGGNQLDSAGPVPARSPARPACSATSGNGPAAPIFPIRASSRPRARSANITASSCARRWCFAAAAARPRAAMCGPATATSSTPISAGCIPGLQARRVTL